MAVSEKQIPLHRRVLLNNLTESAVGLEEPEVAKDPKRKTTTDILCNLYPEREGHIRNIRPLWSNSTGQRFRVNFHYGRNNWIAASAFVHIFKGSVLENDYREEREDPWEVQKSAFRL